MQAQKYLHHAMPYCVVCSFAKKADERRGQIMGIRQDQCNKVCRIIDDYLANRPRERDELIVAVRTVFKEADRKTENSSEIPNNCKGE